jgi:hypothetical protein
VAYAPPAGQGFNIQALWRQWQAVLLHPATTTFDAQQPAANWPTVWLSLLMLAIVEAISQFIVALEPISTYMMTRATGSPFQVHPNPLGNALGSLVGVFIGFFVYMAILFVIANIFGGQGTFLMQAYLVSLFSVPLGIIAAVAAIIPIVAGFIEVLVGLYAIYLSVLAVASAHRFSMGKSWLVVLLPVIVVVVLGVLAIAFFVAVLLAASGVR